MADPMRQDRDLVLPPATYAYVLDQTKGHVSVFVGPTRTSLSNTDQLVRWTGKKYQPITDPSEAVFPFVKASESQYVVLTDPAENKGSDEFAIAGTSTSAVALEPGKKIVLTGPCSFAPWPGQVAEVIDGHKLSYNEYLVVQVYEPTAASENEAIAAPQTGDEGKTKVAKCRDYTMGERDVIRGTDVSYYVPPTGIEVLRDENNSFVRSAATLEQLEYCVLVDENGEKRYEHGPKVVFPKPTERFISESNSRKFRAIELNPQSGLYIKVVAEYKHDETFVLDAWRGNDIVKVKRGETVHEGDELFLTGAHQPIYFPRAEHSVIHYGNQRKHHATAVPAGEGRYVLDRTKGTVDLVRGPKMFLADPRTQVLVRRVLDGDVVERMYPGNVEAQQVNAAWRAEQATIDESYLPHSHAIASTGEAGSLATSYLATKTYGGEKMRRGTEYTPPRQIRLNTKYQGAVAISVFPGYAVLVIDKTGKRRVEVGPTNVLLEYGEELMMMSLSTGRPKNADSLYVTPYLRTVNNQVGDVVTVETSDLVPVTLKLSYRVNFEGEGDERLKWFDVENYVKVLTDHCRSRLRSAARKHNIQKYYGETIDHVRDALLGAVKDGKRVGLHFAENGMRLLDVEVLEVQIADPSVGQLLSQATANALRGAIELTMEHEATVRHAELADLTRQRLLEDRTTAEARAEAELEEIARQQAAAERLAQGKLQTANDRESEAEVLRLTAEHDAETAIHVREQENETLLKFEREQAEIYAKRMAAVDDKLVVALQTLGDQNLIERLAETVGPAAAASGQSISDILGHTLKDTRAGELFAELNRRPLAAGNGSTVK